MKIVAISGSLRAASTNTALVWAAAALAPEGMTVTVYGGLGNLPHFSPELDGDDAPAAVRSLRGMLAEADGALICTPEYAFGMPGSLKNALDWLVTSGELWRKPVVALSASPSALGGEKAHAALLLTLSALEAHVVADGSLCLPFITTKVSKSGDVTDPATAQALRASLDALAQAVEAQADEAAA
jgi:NAD(P)H-dependent FMN reductase